MNDVRKLLENSTMGETLLKAYENLKIRYAFKEGDLVQWKYGLKKFGAEGPFVVWKVYEDDNGLGLGTYDSEGIFRLHYEDPEYFEPYNGEPK